MRIHGLGLAAAALIAACGGGSAPAPTTTATTTETPEAGGAEVSPATPTQVEAGAALYGANCASCHGAGGEGSEGAPAVVGEGVLPRVAPEGAKRDVEFATAGDVFRWVRVAMPGDAPGSLTDAEYAAIMAFALQANGVDMSSTVLDEATADGLELH